MSGFRDLRIKGGFKTMRDAADYTKTSYHTWKKWELGLVNPMEIIWKYLELLIQYNELKRNQK